MNGSIKFTARKMFLILSLFAVLLFSGQNVYAEPKIRPPETLEESCEATPAQAFLDFLKPPKNELLEILKDPVFEKILDLINRAYVDKNPDKEKMLEGALNGMLQSLDPHSRYVNPKKAKEELEERKGTFYGIGARLDKINGENYVKVVSVFENSPAEKAGLKAGDMIIKVKDDAGEITVTKDIPSQDVVGKIRGEKGTKVILTIYREDEADTRKIEITRDEIKVPTVISKKIGADAGYVKLTSFNEVAPAEIKQAIDDLKNKGAEKLILDLRDNPGGLLGAVNSIASELLPAGKTIVSLRDRNGEAEAYLSGGSGFYAEIPFVVLVNGGSASASEILAAAIKENGRGKIVGTATFGKGSVQSVIPLSNGGALHLTIAKFYSPLGNEIHGKGVEPDITVGITDSVNFKPGDPEKDPQLKKAMEILSK